MRNTFEQKKNFTCEDPSEFGSILSDALGKKALRCGERNLGRVNPK